MYGRGGRGESADQRRSRRPSIRKVGPGARPARLPRIPAAGRSAPRSAILGLKPRHSLAPFASAGSLFHSGRGAPRSVKSSATAPIVTPRAPPPQRLAGPARRAPRPTALSPNWANWWQDPPSVRRRRKSASTTCRPGPDVVPPAPRPRPCHVPRGPPLQRVPDPAPWPWPRPLEWRPDAAPPACRAPTGCRRGAPGTRTPSTSRRLSGP